MNEYIFKNREARCWSRFRNYSNDCGFEILFAMGHEAFLLQSSMTFVDLHATLQALPHGKIFERG